jgi:hypothetical protein
MPLSVPYAIDDQHCLVRPDQGLLHGSYRCLQCQERVHFKPGKTKRPHFAHAVVTTCTGESVLHLAAKQALIEELPGLLELGVLLPCRRAACEDVHLEVWTLPPFDAVKTEVPFGNTRLDIALMHNGAVVAAIEVFNTHRIGEEKSRMLSVPWIEVHAETVLENVQLLQPVVQQLVTKSQLRALRPPTLRFTFQTVDVFDQLTRYKDRLFSARQAQQTVVTDHLCEACSAEWAGELQRRKLRANVMIADEQRTAEAQHKLDLELARRGQVEQARRDREAHDAAEKAEALKEETTRAQRQREKFGLRLQHTISERAELFLDAHPREIRYMLNYLRTELQDFSLLQRYDRRLRLQPCSHCGERIVILNTADPFGNIRPYGRLLTYWRKPGASLGWVYNVCLYCRKSQKVRDRVPVKPEVTLDGSVFVEILNAFGQLPAIPIDRTQLSRK